MDHRNGRYRNAAAMTVAALLVFLVFLVFASFMPLFETNIWWVRYMDFPRLQLAVAMFVLLALYLGLRGRPYSAEWIVVIGVLAALGYHACKLHPYSTLVETHAGLQTDCPDGQDVRIMVANVKRKNDIVDAFLDQVASADPDVLLIMETDAWWDARLAALRNRFPYRIQSIPAGHGFYGMHLFSKLELISPEFRLFFGADTPTAVTRLRLANGETIGFIGLHPKPPLAWSQPTTMRDAHLLQAALMARQSDDPTIVAGDINAVPWERVTRRAIRIGRFLDPRVGRGLFATYDARSYLISWPLDQILIQPQFTLQNFETLPDFGSDHLAVVAALCLEPEAAQEAPMLLSDDLAEAKTSLETARNSDATATED